MQRGADELMVILSSTCQLVHERLLNDDLNYRKGARNEWDTKKRSGDLAQD